jgi:hypothetical protein
MDRNSGSKRIFLSDEELARRSAPGGRLPLKGAKSNAYGDKSWTPIHAGSPAAVQAAAERKFARERPDLQARREKAGK